MNSEINYTNIRGYSVRKPLINSLYRCDIVNSGTYLTIPKRATINKVIHKREGITHTGEVKHLFNALSPRQSPKALMKSKRGAGMGEMLFGAVLIVLLVVAMFIAFGVKMFFARSYEMRAVEAELLAEKIERCLEQQAIAWEKEGELYRACGLRKSVLEERAAETKIGILVCEGKCAEGRRVFQLGSNFVVCDLRARTEEDAKCVKKAAVSGGKQYEIVVSSNHQERVT